MILTLAGAMFFITLVIVFYILFFRLKNNFSMEFTLGAFMASAAVNGIAWAMLGDILSNSKYKEIHLLFAGMLYPIIIALVLSILFSLIKTILKKMKI